jgi:hypothetical protein
VIISILAYLDAGSGSLIAQILVGGFAAVAVTAKLYWHRLLRVLHIRRDTKDPEPAAESESSG